ncbi:MAG: diguanylate cyclase [Terriglobia bacterium]|jgi:diguanylate cyclase (GGDEF)-like protein
MRVLIAEDEMVSRRMLEVLLGKWGHEVIVASDGMEAWEALRQKDPPRLAILDWMMPGMDGVEICREIRKPSERPYTYIVLLTGKDRKQDIVEGLEAGADEYLCKPFDHDELRARVRAGCRIVELQECVAMTLEELRAQATHDALTSLWNRSAILDILQRELARSERESSTVSVVLADVDHFKQVNDSQGHRAGDAVLREVTRRMQSLVRPYDALGRYGGEEFMVVVPGTDLAGGQALAERLRAGVDTEPVESPGGPLHITVSFGVAVNKGTKAIDPLIQSADEALYRAKSRGRNCVEAALSCVAH